MYAKNYEKILTKTEKDYKAKTITTVTVWVYTGLNEYMEPYHVTKDVSVYVTEALDNVTDDDEVLNAGRFYSYDGDNLSQLLFKVM